MYTIIDLSKNNGTITPAVLAKNVDGVIVRIGYRGYGSAGTLVTDSMFDKYAKACIGAGIPLAFYFFPTAINEVEAIQEADYAFSLASKYDSKPLIYADSEISDVTNKNGRSDKLSKADRTKYLVKFCDRINAMGGTAGVYASDSWFKDRLDLSQLTKYSLWVAKYSSVAPVYVSNYDGWQFTSKATVSGVAKTANDLSHFYKSFEQIKAKEVKANPYPVPTRLLRRETPMLRGDDVKWLQFELGMAEKDIDGIYGDATNKAYKSYLGM